MKKYRLRKAVSLVLACMMIFMSISASAYSSNKYLNGDVDQNGTINILDATQIQKIIAKSVEPDAEQQSLADFNCDDNINVLDATDIQKLVAKLSDMPDEPVKKPAVGEPISNEINVYYKNSQKWNNVYFYFYNSQTGEQSCDWPGEKTVFFKKDSDGNDIHKYKVDVTKFDRVVFNDGDKKQTLDTPISKASSVFYPASGKGKTIAPGNYAYLDNQTGAVETLSLNYSAGYDKKVWIWTPADYYENSGKIFKTVYVMDGQNIFSFDHRDGYGSWCTSEAVESLMTNGGEGIIIVGIDNGNAKRDSELTPDLGEVIPSYAAEFSNRTGEEFSEFVVNKVMPYVQLNYRSSTNPEDNIIVGASSGGLESFYIGMENPDKFGNIGSLSPAFLLFNEQIWESYLSKFDLSSETMPNLYIYNGQGDSLEKELFDSAVPMYERLKDKSYGGRLTFVGYDAAKHNEIYWRLIFPEMLCWCYDF